MMDMAKLQSRSRTAGNAARIGICPRELWLVDKGYVATICQVRS